MPSLPTLHRATRLTLVCVSLGLALSIGACNSVKPTKARSEEITMYDFSSDIRWGEWDAAYDYVDPKTKKEHPLSDIERGRFKQVEISAYEVLANVHHEGTIDRQIKLDMINRNTQIPRTVSYIEHWRWDDEIKKWWLVSGLPDISPQGE